MTTTATLEKSTMTTLIEKVTTIEGVMEWCEISKKAYTVIENLMFFLKTKEDITNFIVAFEDRFLWQSGGLDWVKLAREIGSYHHEFTSFESLKNMDEKEALERLFNEPMNGAKLYEYKESRATLERLYELKQDKPRLSLMKSLLYI
jgi:hypothetical protein